MPASAGRAVPDGPRPDTPIRLVIFDCDGVLVDSEPIALAVLREAIAEKGLDLDHATVQRRFQGRTLDAVVAALALDGVDFDGAAQDAMNARLYARFSEELRPLAGISVLINRLSVPFCVASSSRTERLRHALATTGLAARFEGRVFSADAVARGKPHPDLFLLAAREMGMSPDVCLVIEDSVAGLQAARAAGMAAIGLAAGGHLAGEARQALQEASGMLAPTVDALSKQFEELGLLRPA